MTQLWKTVYAFIGGSLISGAGWVSLTNPDAAVFKHLEFIAMGFSCLFFPGLFASMAISGNVHDMNLGVAAVVNILLYGVILRLVFRAIWKGSTRHGTEE